MIKGMNNCVIWSQDVMHLSVRGIKPQQKVMLVRNLVKSIPAEEGVQ